LFDAIVGAGNPGQTIGKAKWNMAAADYDKLMASIIWIWQKEK
jgi:hypothetical protein